MRFGVHVSIGKGLPRAVQAAKDLGCDAFQIFSGNPRGWQKNPWPRRTWHFFAKGTRLRSRTRGRSSVLSTQSAAEDELYAKSIKAITEEYQRAVTIDADYFVVHPGKAGKQDRDRPG